MTQPPPRPNKPLHCGQLGNKYRDLFFSVVQRFIATYIYAGILFICMVTALKFFCQHLGTEQPFLFPGFVKYRLQSGPRVQRCFQVRCQYESWCLLLSTSSSVCTDRTTSSRKGHFYWPAPASFNPSYFSSSPRD